MRMAPRVAAYIVSTWANHAAALAIDGDMSTLCASHSDVGNWLSVRVPLGTPIGYVAVHNRRDAYWRGLLGHFEVWVGRAPGDTTSAHAVRCGEASYDESTEPAPYTLCCADVTAVCDPPPPPVGLSAPPPNLVSSAPASPVSTCDAGLASLRLETRDANGFAFEDASGAFTPGRFDVVDVTSLLQTRVRGADATVWYSREQYWPRNAATTIRAVLGTSTLAAPQRLRVMYQLRDPHGNTRTESASNPSVEYAGGSLACGEPDGVSGIGECAGTLPSSLYAMARTLPLTLVWGSVRQSSFASVHLQQQPAWSRAGGWNAPTGTVGQDVAFGAVLPFEDVYIAEGNSRASVSVQIFLKTHMAEDSAAERQVAVGMFKLLYPSTACSVTGDSARHGAFATWEVVSGMAAGEYGLLFRNGQVEGHAIHMVTVALSCVAGTHAIGVQTSSHSDSNGLSSSPNAEYATSVGRGDGCVTRASVLVKQTSEDVAVFAYPADGRASLNNLASIGRQASALAVRLDSISDDPGVPRSVNVPCSGTCSYLPAPLFGGSTSLPVSHGSASVVLEVRVLKPNQVVLSVDDGTLSAIGCQAGGDAVSYQSTRLRLRVDGLDMTHLASFRSADPAVAQVVGDRVIGRRAGRTRISTIGGAASVSILVVDSVLRPQLVARIVTSLSASSREQTFDSENDVGFLYIAASYTNDDWHTLDATAVAVSVAAASKVAYALDGNRHRVSVVRDALAGSSCTEPLLRVSLAQCTSSVDVYEPPLDLRLPSPLILEPLTLSQTVLAPPGSFARSAALSHRPAARGEVTRARVVMSTGVPQSLLGDARLHLNSSDPTCIAVVADLSDPRNFDYRALDGGSCTSAVLTATATLGSWVASTNATVYIARVRALTVDAALHPACPSPATTLRTLGCANPLVRQRVRFAASYVLESDVPSYAPRGSVDLAHGDVSITRTNLQLISGIDVHQGTASGLASFAIVVRGVSAARGITISDSPLTLSAISPAVVDETLVSSLALRVGATFSGQGVSCLYSDAQVRSHLGMTIQDVATFEVPSQYAGLLSVASDGTLTAIATHWAQAPVLVRNRCMPSQTSQLAVYVNPRAPPGGLDMGSETRAPLQAGNMLSIPLWFDLSSAYANACGAAPIETVAARLFFHSTQLDARSATNQWTPHGGSYQGTLQLVPRPVDAPEPSSGYDRWSQVVYAGIVQPSFDGRSWGLQRAATIVLNVRPGVSLGTVGLQLELACGGAVHFLPSASTLHEMRFTTAWESVQLPPAARRQLHHASPPPRRQLQPAALVHGDVTGDGVTNALDLTAVVNYFKAPSTLDLSAMSANQRLWLDANRDGTYANAGDVLYAARAFAGATVYPVFGDLACPTRTDEALSLTVACYSAGQALLNAVASIKLGTRAPRRMRNDRFARLEIIHAVDAVSSYPETVHDTGTAHDLGVARSDSAIARSNSVLARIRKRLGSTHQSDDDLSAGVDMPPTAHAQLDPVTRAIQRWFGGLSDAAPQDDTAEARQSRLSSMSDLSPDWPLDPEQMARDAEERARVVARLARIRSESVLRQHASSDKNAAYTANYGTQRAWETRTSVYGVHSPTRSPTRASRVGPPATPKDEQREWLAHTMSQMRDAEEREQSTPMGETLDLREALTPKSPKSPKTPKSQF